MAEITRTKKRVAKGVNAGASGTGSLRLADDPGANTGPVRTADEGSRILRLPGAKQQRIAVRLSSQERELIDAASRAASTTVSDFVLRATIARAEDVLAERRQFPLSPEQWSDFVAMLDRPPVLKPRLRALLTDPSILDR